MTPAPMTTTSNLSSFAIEELSDNAFTSMNLLVIALKDLGWLLLALGPEPGLASHEGLMSD